MSESPVSLEDLLKLKRHEQPQGNFWDGFERDFQHRRLRALMEEAEPRFELFRGGLWRRLLIWSPVACGAMATLAFFLGMSEAGLHEAGIAASDRQDSGSMVAKAEQDGRSPSFAESAVALAKPVRAQSPGPALDLQSVPVVARPRFALDALATQEDTRAFRRVLSSASLSVPTSAGSRYVADPLTAGRMEAAPAVMRSGTHF